MQASARPPPTAGYHDPGSHQSADGLGRHCYLLLAAPTPPISHRLRQRGPRRCRHHALLLVPTDNNAAAPASLPSSQSRPSTRPRSPLLHPPSHQCRQALLFVPASVSSSSLPMRCRRRLLPAATFAFVRHYLLLLVDAVSQCLHLLTTAQSMDKVTTNNRRDMRYR